MGGVTSRERRSAVVLALVLGVVLLALTPWTTLWDRDEPRYARAAVEMARGGGWLVPTLNGEPRVRKPPLVYWLMAASVRAAGVREAAVRCWSPLAVAVTALLVYGAARRGGDHRVGLTAMVAVAVNPMMAVQGTAATTDAILLVGLTAATLNGWRVIVDGVKARPMACTLAGVAVATLAKGLVGLAVPLLVVAVAVWLERRRRWQPQRLVAVSAVAMVGAVPYVVWLAAADSLTAGAAVRDGLWRETWQRLATPLEGHGVGRWAAPPFYAGVTVAGFAPWVIWLREGLTAVRRRPDASSLVLAWAGVTLVVVLVAATQLPHYLLPAWPPFALAAAHGVHAASTGATRRRGPVIALTVMAAVFSAAAIAVAILVPATMLPALSVGATVLVGTHLTLRAIRRADADATWQLHAVFTGAALVLAAGWLAPSLEPLKVVPAVTRLAARAGPLPVATCRVDDPSLLFYLDRDHVERLDDEAAVARWATGAGPALLVADAAACGRLPEGAAVRAFGRVRGFDYVSGRWREVTVATRAAR